MGEHIVGRLIQTNKQHQYQPGKDVCSCFHCSIFTDERPCNFTGGIKDWQLSESEENALKSECCGGLCRHQPVCVQPDREECEIGRGVNDEDPLIEYGWEGVAPNLKCVYNIDNVNTRSQVLKFIDKFGMNDDIEMKYCTQKVTTACPNGMKSCSRLKSIGEGGDECRKWFESRPKNIQDATIQNYCLRNNTEDCKCVNRSKNDAYISGKGSYVFSDGCWYVPCANKSGQYLVPSNLIKPDCPNNVCTQVYDFIKTGNVSIDNVKNDIMCDFSSQKAVNDDIVNKSAKMGFVNKYKYQIIFVFVIGVAMWVVIKKIKK
jgi:hypothetical protein